MPAYSLKSVSILGVKVWRWRVADPCKGEIKRGYALHKTAARFAAVKTSRRTLRMTPPPMGRDN